MLEKFAENVGAAHMQLMEGAITYVEFFNKVWHLQNELMNNEAFSEEHRQATAEMDSWKDN